MRAGVTEGVRTKEVEYEGSRCRVSTWRYGGGKGWCGWYV